MRQDGWGWALGEEGSGRGAPSPRGYEANPADGAPTPGKVEPALAPLWKHLLQSEQRRSCSGARSPRMDSTAALSCTFHR